jgi:hypothetical protein
MTQVLYKGRKRMVHVGKSGGRYVIVEGNKRYIRPKTKIIKKKPTKAKPTKAKPTKAKPTKAKPAKKKPTKAKRKTMKGGVGKYPLPYIKDSDDIIYYRPTTGKDYIYCSKCYDRSRENGRTYLYLPNWNRSSSTKKNPIILNGNLRTLNTTGFSKARDAVLDDVTIAYFMEIYRRFFKHAAGCTSSKNTSPALQRGMTTRQRGNISPESQPNAARQVMRKNFLSNQRSIINDMVDNGILLKTDHSHKTPSSGPVTPTHSPRSRFNNSIDASTEV